MSKKVSLHDDSDGIIKILDCKEFEDNINRVKICFYTKDGKMYYANLNTFSEEGDASVSINSTAELNENDFLYKIKTQSWNVAITWPGEGIGLY